MKIDTQGFRYLSLVFLSPIVVTAVGGSLLSAAVGKYRFLEAFLIPVGWVDYWASNGYTHILIVIGLVILVGVVGIAVKKLWIVVVSTSALSIFLSFIILISNWLKGGFGG